MIFILFKWSGTYDKWNKKETKKKEKLLQWDFWFTNRCNWHKYDNGMAYQETKM